MTSNKRTIDAYMEGFRTTDRRQILSCLTDDVEWEIPGAFNVRGKDEFEKHIVDEGFSGHPMITVTRLIEEDDVVVAEGFVRAPKGDGTFLDLVFCDVFEMQKQKIRRLVSYLVQTK
jgi:ketosteroid isomerase-like protein